MQSIGGTTATTRMVGALGDLAAVLLALPGVELGRMFLGPAPLVARMRAFSKRLPERAASERTRLRRVIASVDARLPGGANCYRRSLLEVALDPDAAAEPFFLGLASSGGHGSGHVWIGPRSDRRAYGAVICL